MTEIPEHLLKRSKERRAAIGGEAASESEASASDESPAPAPAETGGDTAPAPVPAPAAPAEPAPPPPPEPVRPEVAAALNRRKIPYWAMPVLLALPLWAYAYQATLEPPPEHAGPLTVGAQVYGGCASCHGADGAGIGSAPGFDTVRDTWPDFRDHMMWVRLGNVGWPADTYGAQDKPNGSGMPPHTFSDAQLAAVVLYERVRFGGLTEADEEYELLVAIAEGETTFEEAGLGELSEAAGVDPAQLTTG